MKRIQRALLVRLGASAFAGFIWACSSTKISSSSASLTNDTAAIQAYLDATFYSDADVKHTFVTRAGEKIECIDFYAQRSVKGMIAAGVDITANVPPAPPTPPAKVGKPNKPTGSVAFDGSLDENGNSRSCPAGTVPETRPTVAKVLATGGLEAFRSQKKPLPIDPNQDPSQHDCYFQTTAGPGYDHAAGLQALTYYGGLTTVSVHKPFISDNANEHTLAEMWVQTNECEDWSPEYGGSNTCLADGGATMLPVQSVEVGWMVGNGGPPSGCENPDGSSCAGGTDPYLFAFISQDGYSSVDHNCFARGAGGGGLEGSCCPAANDGGAEGTDCWVVAPMADFAVGQSLGSYVQPIGDVPAEMAIQIWNGSAYGFHGWYVYIDGNLIGWYPTSGVVGTAAFSGPMASHATYLQVGGEVFDSWPDGAHTTTEMGSGIHPECGARFAAYHRNVNYIDILNDYHDATLSFIEDTPDAELDYATPGICGYDAMGSDFGDGYGYNMWAASTRGDPPTDWGTYFMYGGPNGYYCPYD